MKHPDYPPSRLLTPNVPNERRLGRPSCSSNLKDTPSATRPYSVSRALIYYRSHFPIVLQKSTDGSCLVRQGVIESFLVVDIEPVRQGNGTYVDAIIGQFLGQPSLTLRHEDRIYSPVAPKAQNQVAN